MPTRTLIIALALLLLWSNGAFAQTLLQGKVSDQNGEPLVGVTVLLHQSKLATFTKADGSYQLPIPANLKSFTVQFSLLGYKSKLETLTLSDAPSDAPYTLNVTLVETPIESEEIVVTAGFVKEQEALPYPIATVMKKDVVSSGAVNLSQAIARTPGIYFSSFGNAVGKPVIRGLTNANVILLNGGIKQENFNFSSNHPFLVDEFTASRVEAIKGPASLQYGSDAVGGVIHVVRERPAQPNSLEGDVVAHYNSNTIGYLTTLGIRGSLENFFLGVRGSLKSHEDFRDGNNAVVANTRFNEQNATVNAGVRLPFGIFSLNYNYTKAKYGLQNQSQLALFQNQAALLEQGRNNQVWYQNLDNSFISSNNTIFFGNHTLDIDLGYQMNRREGIGGAFNAQQRQLVIPTFALMQLNTFTANAKTNLSFENARLLFGINLASVRNDADETKPNNPLLDSEINDVGVYAIADLRLTESLILTGGLRYDFRAMKSFPTPTQTTNQFRIDNTYNNLTGSVGITYNLTPSQFIKLNVARGFRSPTMPELTQNGIHGGRYERGNPNLRAQLNHQIDFNYHLHTNWLTLDITPFYNLVSGYIYLVQTTEPAPIGQGRVFQHTQNDAALYGGEVALDIHPIEWVGTHFSYSLVRADLLGDPLGFKHPTFTPQDRITGELKFEQKSLGFFKRPYLALEVMHFFEQNRTGQNETPTPAYTLFNARIGTSLAIGAQEIDFFINGNNLTNAAYIDHLSVTKPLNLNMIGRNIVFGVQAPFVLRNN